MKKLGLIFLLLIVFLSTNLAQTKPKKSRSQLLKQLLALKSTSDSKNCTYQCPEGKSPDQLPIDSSNPVACGPGNYTYDFSLIGYEKINPCCLEHDICYSTCYRPKEDCDNEFDKCLKTVCSDKKDCTALANSMVKAVKKLGCSNYQSAQEYFCNC